LFFTNHSTQDDNVLLVTHSDEAKYKELIKDKEIPELERSTVAGRAPHKYDLYNTICANLLAGAGRCAGGPGGRPAGASRARRVPASLLDPQGDDRWKDTSQSSDKYVDLEQWVSSELAWVVR
jgi:hypothetical protein